MTSTYFQNVTVPDLIKIASILWKSVSKSLVNTENSPMNFDKFSQTGKKKMPIS